MLEFVVRERRLRWPIAAHVEAAVRGRTVRSIERRAKYILIGFDTGTLILHLGMSGSLRLVKRDAPIRIHDHWDIRVDSGWVLRFHDPRRFGSLHWTETDPALHPLLVKLAPEPLSDAFDGEYLFRATRKRSVAIKQLIMNSQLVVGVGNIYASEALFRAQGLAAARGPPAHPPRGRGARPGHQGGARRSDQDRRHHPARLRQRRRRARIFQPETVRV